MIYNEFQGMKLSALGMGNMRLPVWVMEPVRGGQLATLSDEATAKLAEMRPDEKVCPQTIHIPEHLHNFAVKLGRA